MMCNGSALKRPSTWGQEAALSVHALQGNYSIGHKTKSGWWLLFQCNCFSFSLFQGAVWVTCIHARAAGPHKRDFGLARWQLFCGTLCFPGCWDCVTAIERWAFCAILFPRLPPPFASITYVFTVFLFWFFDFGMMLTLRKGSIIFCYWQHCADSCQVAGGSSIQQNTCNLQECCPDVLMYI